MYPYARRYRVQIGLGVLSLLMTDLLVLVPPWMTKLAVDSIQKNADPRILFRYASAIVLAVAGLSVFRFFWRKYLFGISIRVEYDLRNDFFRHLQRLSWLYHQGSRTGDLVSRATNDFGAVREFLGMGILILVDCSVTLVSCVTLMMVINVPLTLMTLVPLVSLTVFLSRLGLLIKHRYTLVQEELANLSSVIQESLSGIRLVQAYVREAYEISKFTCQARELSDQNVNLSRAVSVFFPFMILATGFANILALGIGGRYVVAQTMTLGDYAAFIGYLALLTWPMSAIGYIFNVTQRGAASMERIDEFLSTKPEILDPVPGLPVNTLEGKIEFRNVRFSYPEGGEVLSDVHFSVPKGSLVAVTGEIGSGKSTLVRLIPRIYDPAWGAVLVDDQPVNRIPLSVLRRHIGYVEQEPFLFSLTIRENVLFGNEHATETELEEAIRFSGLAKDRGQFPEGWETIVGERGVILSGGQKQRVALARAFLKKPAILILDDSFSNLDSETEEEILQRIREEMGTITILAVSHRVSTLRRADRIVVLSQGRPVEQGTHEELLAKRQFYFRIYRRQMLAELELVEEDPAALARDSDEF